MQQMLPCCRSANALGEKTGASPSMSLLPCPAHPYAGSRPSLLCLFPLFARTMPLGEGVAGTVSVEAGLDFCPSPGSGVSGAL